MSRRLIVRIVVLVALASILVSAQALSAVAQPTSATAELGQTATLVAKEPAPAAPPVPSFEDQCRRFGRSGESPSNRPLRVLQHPNPG